MCAFFSILLGITILAILELAHPYQGTVTIPDEPFRYALSRMEEVGNYKMAKVESGAANPQISQILSVAVIPSRKKTRDSSRISFGTTTAE